jgi:hypothetical protein
MRRMLLAALFSLPLLVATAAASGTGEPAPGISGKEWIHTEPLAPKDLAGRVLYIDIFRTW